MLARLTERQNQVFEFIRTHIRTVGKPPTIKEIGRGVSIGSTNGVHKMLVVLETKGYITRTPNVARGIDLVGEDPYASADLPSVLALKLQEGVGKRARRLTSEAAAHPLPRSRQPLVVDPSLIPDDVDLDDCLGVVASDDGMNGAGVRKGDRVIVEEAAWQDVPNGSLAAVLFYDRVVIRRFEYVNQRLHFRAADRTYADESAGPEDLEYFVIGRALAMMRTLA